jgi:hypothetical protein
LANTNNQLMDNLRIDLDISPSLQRLLRNNSQIAPRATQLGLRAVTKEGSKQVKAQIRSDGLVQSGKYVKSVRSSTTKTKSLIYTRSRIANILENGATPHRIEPRNGKFLRFKYNGKMILSKGVDHPGLKAYNPFDVVWSRMQGSGQVNSLFSDGVQKAIEAIQNGS